MVNIAPNRTPFTRGLIKYISKRDYFRTVPSQNGGKCNTTLTLVARLFYPGARARINSNNVFLDVFCDLYILTFNSNLHTPKRLNLPVPRSRVRHTIARVCPVVQMSERSTVLLSLISENGVLDDELEGNVHLTF